MQAVPKPVKAMKSGVVEVSHQTVQAKGLLDAVQDRSFEIAPSAKNSVTLLNCDSARID